MGGRAADLCRCVAGRADQAADYGEHGNAEGDCMSGKILWVVVLICGSTFGEIAMTYGLKATGEPARLRPKALLFFLGRAVCNGWFWAAIPLMALSFYALLVLLSWEPISFVIPASALSYVLGTLGAQYILKEEVNAARWAGGILVWSGVRLVGAGLA